MVNGSRIYLLDSNIFIQAKNQYYSFSVCPGFWEAIPWLHQKGLVWSIDRVRQELLEGDDELAKWTKEIASDSMFAETTEARVVQSFSEIMAWVQKNPQFKPSAKAGFARDVDGWLVALARLRSFTVVTHEEYREDVKRTIPIPNICKQFNVNYVNTFRMLEDLKTRFTWEAPK